MKLYTSARNGLSRCFVSGLCLLFACFLLLPNQALSQEDTYKFALTNKSDVRVTKVILSPHGLIQIHTNASLAPGEKVEISRPECKKMRIEIKHSKGSFSFPFTDFSNEKNTAMSLFVRKDSVPVLKFEERKRGDITGDNSDWNFTQVLGAIPFGVGTTTVAQAQALGAKASKKKSGLETTIYWDNRPWNVSLEFSGEAPDSKLVRMDMVAKGAHGKTPSVVHDSLMSHGYVYYSIGQKKSLMELYVTVPLARALEKANTNGRNPAAVLAVHPNEVVAQSFRGKGTWTVSMTLAPYLMKNQ